MIPSVVLWILAIVGCLLIGREVAKLRSGKPSKLPIALPIVPTELPSVLPNTKRAALDLAIRLREVGLKMVPTVLEDLAMGDVGDMIAKIHDVAAVARSGSDAIMKELDGTFDRVLTAKLKSPEGRAAIKARLAEVEQALATAAKVATAGAAVAALL